MLTLALRVFRWTIIAPGQKQGRCHERMRAAETANNHWINDLIALANENAASSLWLDEVTTVVIQPQSFLNDERMNMNDERENRS